MFSKLMDSSHDIRVQDECFEDLKADNITIENDIIDQAKQNKPDAIHAIGCEYARMNKREKAIQWLGTSAAMGLDKSQLELGHLFAESGHYECAFEWYSRPRIRRVAAAPFYMANVMFKEKRYEEAIKYYYESANLGDANAQLQLALACYNLWGLDSPRYLKNIPMYIRLDTRKAKHWFYESAKGGNNEAAYYMGQLYENGRTVPVDKYHALAWYNESKARGYLPAVECIERLHKQGYVHVPKDKTILYHKKTIPAEILYLGIVVIAFVVWFLIK